MEKKGKQRSRMGQDRQMHHRPWVVLCSLQPAAGAVSRGTGRRGPGSKSRGSLPGGYGSPVFKSFPAGKAREWPFWDIRLFPAASFYTRGARGNRIQCQVEQHCRWPGSSCPAPSPRQAALPGIRGPATLG